MEQQNGEAKIMGIKRETAVLAIAIVGSVFAAVALFMPQFYSIDSNFDRMDGSIKALNDALLQTNATVAELAKESAAQNAAQNEAIRALSADVAANGAALADLNNRVGNVEARLGNVEVRLGNVESRLGKVEVRLDNIERRLPDVEEMDDRLDDLEQGQATLEQGQAELKKRVDALIIANAE